MLAQTALTIFTIAVLKILNHMHYSIINHPIILWTRDVILRPNNILKRGRLHCGLCALGYNEKQNVQYLRRNK